MSKEDGSYALFNYARDKGVPYSDVLSFADAYGNRFTSMTEWQKRAVRKLMHTATGQDVIELVKVERARRAGAARMSPTVVVMLTEPPAVKVLPLGETPDSVAFDESLKTFAEAHGRPDECSEMTNACEQEEGA